MLERWEGIFSAPSQLGFQNENIKILTQISNRTENMVGLIEDRIRKIIKKETRNWNIATNWTIMTKNSLVMK